MRAPDAAAVAAGRIRFSKLAAARRQRVFSMSTLAFIVNAGVRRDEIEREAVPIGPPVAR